MLSTLLPAGTRLYMESSLGARISGITLDYGRRYPLFTFPNSLGLEGRERIGEHHMLGYYRKYVEPKERFRPGWPKDYLFVAEGRFKDYSLTAVECHAAASLVGAAAAAPLGKEAPAALASALERIRAREAELLAELAAHEQVRIAQERLVALEFRVATARLVLK